MGRLWQEYQSRNRDAANSHCLNIAQCWAVISVHSFSVFEGQHNGLLPFNEELQFLQHLLGTPTVHPTPCQEGAAALHVCSPQETWPAGGNSWAMLPIMCTSLLSAAGSYWAENIDFPSEAQTDPERGFYFLVRFLYSMSTLFKSLWRELHSATSHYRAKSPAWPSSAQTHCFAAWSPCSPGLAGRNAPLPQQLCKQGEEHHGATNVSASAFKIPKAVRVQLKYMGFCIFMHCFRSLQRVSCIKHGFRA